VRAAFHKIDVNGDGVVQRKEIEALLDDAETLDEESLLERRPLHDMGNDDALSLHELLARYPDMDDDTRNLVRAAFHKIDVNGDGVVQRKEIEALLDDAETLDEEPFLETVTFDTALDATDTDGDGVLSVDELVAQDPTMDAATKLLVKRVFEEADQNGDGRIDDDEFGGFLHALDEKSDEDS